MKLVDHRLLYVVRLRFRSRFILLLPPLRSRSLTVANVRRKVCATFIRALRMAPISILILQTGHLAQWVRCNQNRSYKWLRIHCSWNMWLQGITHTVELSKGLWHILHVSLAWGGWTLLRLSKSPFIKCSEALSSLPWPFLKYCVQASHLWMLNVLSWL